MRSKTWKDPNRKGYYFIAPYFIVFSIFVCYPIFYSFYLSFQRWDGISPILNVGWNNYSRLLEDRVFYLSLGNTLKIWIAAFVPQMAVALLLAAMFTLSKIRGTSFFRALFYLPNLITALRSDCCLTCC